MKQVVVVGFSSVGDRHRIKVGLEQLVRDVKMHPYPTMEGAREAGWFDPAQKGQPDLVILHEEGKAGKQIAVIGLPFGGCRRKVGDMLVSSLTSAEVGTYSTLGKYLEGADRESTYPMPALKLPSPSDQQLQSSAA